jgi:hypothetical protein
LKAGELLLAGDLVLADDLVLTGDLELTGEPDWSSQRAVTAVAVATATGAAATADRAGTTGKSAAADRWSWLDSKVGSCWRRTVVSRAIKVFNCRWANESVIWRVDIASERLWMSAMVA